MLPDCALSKGNREGPVGTKGWKVRLASLLGHPTNANQRCSLPNVVIQPSHGKGCQLGGLG